MPEAAVTADRVVIVVVDGLRPDSITERDTPALAGLRERSVRFASTHSAVPSVTLVNGSVLATGYHPARTGVLGNNMFVPAADSDVLALTGWADLQRLAGATGGVALTGTLAQRLAGHGRQLVTVGSGSVGTTMCASPAAMLGAGLMVNCDDPAKDGPVGVPDWVGDEVARRFGPPPTKRDVADRAASVRYATSVLTDYVLPCLDPDVALLWLTEPDGTQHAHHVGSPRTLAVLRQVDAAVGAVLEALERRGRSATTAVVVVSDHGCTRIVAPAVDITGALVRAGLKRSQSSGDVVVVNNGSQAIHVPGGESGLVGEIVRFLQGQPWAGPIFTRGRAAGSSQGEVEGTFAFDTIHLAGGRGCPDILLTPSWTAETNEFGVPGRTRFTTGTDRSNHGSLSPGDMATTFLAAGAGFRSGGTLPTPAGNVDVAPTVLALLGIEDGLDTLDGRVLVEALRDGVDPPGVAVETRTLVAAAPEVGYRAGLRVRTAGGVSYVDSGWRDGSDLSDPDGR